MNSFLSNIYFSLIINIAHFSAVFILDMQTTWEEYKDWSPDGIDPNVEQIYKKAVEKMTMLLPHEQKLVSTATQYRQSCMTNTSLLANYCKS